MKGVAIEKGGFERLMNILQRPRPMRRQDILFTGREGGGIRGWCLAGENRAMPIVGEFGTADGRDGEGLGRGFDLQFYVAS